jgi:hypothetical protein
VLGRQEGPPQVDRQDLVEVLGLDLVDGRLHGAGGPRAVHQDVDPAAEPVERGVHHRPDRGLVAHVRPHHERLATQLPCLARHLLERRHLARGEHAIGPLAGQPQDDRSPHPLRPAGHQRHLVSQLHRAPSPST